MSESVSGFCRLCGSEGPLTKEHIPPASTYFPTRARVRVQSGEEYLRGRRGTIHQAGFHERVLCAKCNNNTGAWYGAEYARWCEAGRELLRHRAGTAPPRFVGYPLRIAKQVITTMLVASAPALGNVRPDLIDYVLDRESCQPRAPIRLAGFVCPTASGRTTGLCSLASLTDGHLHRCAEFALPPFGYVLTLDGEPLDDRPVDIAWFSRCTYDERCSIDLSQFPWLPTHEPFPGDYRSKFEIRRDTIENVLIEEGHPSPHERADEIMREGGGELFHRLHGETW